MPSHRILIVDDEPTNTSLLEALLTRWGYEQVRSVNDPREAVAAYREFKPDLLMLDLHMPFVDGFEVMHQLEEVDDGVRVPIIVLTADASRETKRRALASGGQDFVTKPFDADEVKLRIANLLRTRRLEVAAEENRRLLEERVAERTAQLEEARLETVVRLAIASEYHDDAVGDHIFRVSRTTARIAKELGMDDETVALLREASTLHDVGKIGVPDSILLKPGPLDDDEWDVMRSHTNVGAQILGDSTARVLTLAAEIARSHHERWDGNGYPDGLRGEEIPISGRIVAIADVFDALTQSRPYKEAWDTQRAVEEIENSAGTHFDPRIVDAFLRLDHESLVGPVDESERFAEPGKHVTA